MLAGAILLCGSWLCGAEDEMPRVEVTGRLREVNGVGEIPHGLFGVQATKLTPVTVKQWGIEAVRVTRWVPDGVPVVPGDGEAGGPSGIKRVLECFWDRYQPALPLLKPKDWSSDLERLARNYGANAKASGQAHTIELWNEPSQNWASNPGVNFDGSFYDSSNAAEGQPVVGKDGQPVPNLVWTRGFKAVRVDNGWTDYEATHRAPNKETLKAGATFTWNEREYRWTAAWWAKDTTQRYAWSGAHNRALYHRMLEVFGPALKAAHPQVALVAGWGFPMNYEGWKAWETLYRPLIDHAHDYVDGLNEHHFGGDTRSVAGTYETAWAYGKTRYGKSLAFYNTAASGMLDPGRPSASRADFAGTPEQIAYGAFRYTVRDLLHLLEVCPDKAVSRFAHEADRNGGDALAFELLKPLRGKLVEVRNFLPRLWVVAGFGPVEGGSTVLCIAAYNDAPDDRIFSLVVQAPPGWGVVHQREAWVEAEPAGLVLLGTESGRAEGRAEKIELHGEMAAHSARVWTLRVTGKPEKPPAVSSETQWPARETLERLAPGEARSFKIALPDDGLAALDEAYVKFVVDGNDRERLRLSLNGSEIKLGELEAYTNRIRIDSALLKAENELRFECAAGAQAPLLIATASLVTVKELKP
ncbi:MAG: hypothetical protein AMXMBFR7_15960 [Planctomycetota bacterium]